MRIEVVRRPLLHDVTILHQHDVIRHRHGFGLVMRDVDGGNAQLRLNLLQLIAHLIAELRVEVAKRLVQQEHLRIAHQRTSQCHTLTLTAGELRRLAVKQFIQTQHRGHRVHALLDFFLRRFLGFQRKRHVLAHGHVRIQRVFLEHHRDVALLRRHEFLFLAALVELVHRFIPETDFAVNRMEQTRNAVHCSRLAAAGRPKEDAEFAVLDFQIHVLDDIGLALVVGHVHVLNRNRCHGGLPFRNYF